MIQAPIDEERLKEVLKQAPVEVLEGKRDLLYDLLTQALEDIALAKAIEEGEGTNRVAR